MRASVRGFECAMFCRKYGGSQREREGTLISGLDASWTISESVTRLDGMKSDAGKDLPRGRIRPRLRPVHLWAPEPLPNWEQLR